MGILDEGERQFIDLYMHMIGRSEVPRRFHFWSCMSLLAACGDRYWGALGECQRLLEERARVEAQSVG